MIKANSTPPGKSKTKERKKNHDLGDDKVTVTTISPPPSDPTKPPGYCDDPPKRKGI